MHRHMRNIVIASILAVLALAAGIKGYVHHQFKTNIDNTLSSIQMFAQVKYSDLSTSLISGEIKLENVRVASSFLPSEINLGNLTLETPGIAYMIKGPDAFNSGELPDHLGFAINDFYFDLNDELAEWLDSLVSRMQVVYRSERKICGGKSLFGPKEYKEMGYTRLLSNMRMAYDFNESNIFAGKTEQITLYGSNVSYTFKTPGEYNVTLVVADRAGNWDIDCSADQ